MVCYTFLILQGKMTDEVGAGPVEWDETLAGFARDYAPICQLTHS